MDTTIIKDAPAFDFYPERWTHGTRHMTKIERCDYLDLLCAQWDQDGLPDDMTRIALILGYRRAALIPSLVLEKFPLAADGRRRNPKLEEVRDDQRQRISKSRAKIEKMNAARASCRSSTRESTSDSCSGSSRASSPLTTHHSPHNPSASAEGGAGGTGQSPPPAGAGLEGPRTSRKAQPITDEWLDELAKRYPYADVRQQLLKAQSWVETKPGRTLNRAFFVNWLNRIEPPSQAHGPQPKAGQAPASDNDIKLI